ncbi:heme-binding protein [Microbacterium sp. BK668]|uniref:SOUL family heme-binding protein n=1 Tax=Microbacterium sp. BK668 TaxID=2512118 RepID=UPI00105EF884|nr:heme-binding protein [Microbacterium sp. BK668]TDN92205.1 SOUL heme-binding protein [Microbacterium sp. BK668]
MTEQQPYDVVQQFDSWELRSYPSHVVAETVVRGASFEDAGNRAFRSLAGYIGGENVGRRSIAMTAPVVQSPEKIAMTAPVLQQKEGEGFVVAFVLPAGITEADAPVPTHPDVRLRTVPEQLVAALRFPGRWTRSSWERHRDDLLADVRAAGLIVQGEPRFARFNPPITPSFLRHNEVLVDVARSA